MHIKRRFSKILAIVLCLQLMLTSFASTSVVYAAEETEQNPILSSESASSASDKESVAEAEEKNDAKDEETAKEPSEKATQKKVSAAEEKTSEKSQQTKRENETSKDDSAALSKEEKEDRETKKTAENSETNKTADESSVKAAKEAEKEEKEDEKTEEVSESSKKTEDESEEDADEETWNTSPIQGHASKDGVTVTVSAPKGSFPKNTELKIDSIGASETDEIAQSIGAGKEAVAFDISFLSADGEKVQPRDGYLVDARFEIGEDSILASPEGEGGTLHVYHVADQGTAEEVGSLEAPEEGSAEFRIQARAFSPYIVVKDTPEELTRANRDAAVSANLSDFLVNVECSAPTDENGNYVINPNDSYEMTFSFRENEKLQFDNEADLVYELPEGLQVSDVNATSFDIKIVDTDGSATITNNTYEVSDGKLIVRFNQNDPNFDRLKALANVAFEVSFSVQIDENAGSIVFNSDLEKDFIFESLSDLAITKQVSYDGESDTANYVLTITSTGDNENVTVQDILSGTALVLNHDVTVTSSVSGTISPEIDYETVSNGFVFQVPEMQNNEVLTIRYSAAVDNTKISSNGTVEQTKNKAKVTSDQVPDGKEAEANFAGLVKFHRIDKSAEGEPVQIAENLYEQTWRIEVNQDHKVKIGGAPISDWITSRSRQFMHFTGDGITVLVTMEDGSTQTREVSWDQLILYTDSGGTYGWAYTTPESDGKASYVITCKTLIDTSNALNDIKLSNGAQVYNAYDEAEISMTGVGDDEFDFEKHALGTTSQESSWELVYHADGNGYSEAHIVDDMPKVTFEGEDYVDYLQEDSIEVTGLLEGESYRVRLNSDKRTLVLTFYQDEAQTQPGLKPTPDGAARDIIIRFKTTVDQDWLNFAASNGYEQYSEHKNNATAYANNNPVPGSDKVVPIKQTLKKESVGTDSVEIDGTTYPVYHYSLTLTGVTEDNAEISDTFDTEYLKYYEAEGVRILGGMNLNPTDSNGTVTAADYNNGLTITVSRFPKRSDGSFYPVYKIFYSLIVKDEAALTALNEAAVENGSYTLTNVARWNELTSDEVHVVHTYYPYVDKELVSQASADNDYVAEFKLIINKDAGDLDPTSDTLNIQDELSPNLRFIQDSLSISPEAEGMKTQFDGETNTLIFSDVPDNTRFEITYRARVLGKGNITYSNTVKFGNYEKTVEDDVKIDSSGSGSGSNPSITLVKRDTEDVTVTLAGATFQLFYLDDGAQVPVTDRNGDNVFFTTGADGSVLIAGNQNTLGWTLWEGRTYQLVEVTAPAGYELNKDPTEFILSDTPSSQMEYDLTGDSVSAWDTKIKTSVPVKKEWIGPAAQSVTVQLKVGEETIKTATLSEENNWQYTFTNVDQYDANGELIQYTVEEEPLEGYSSMRDGTMSDGYVITNTNTETVDVPVKKEWIGPAADQVTINLLADDVPIDKAELTSETGWDYTFTNLPKYDSEDGHVITYSVEEERLDGYEPEYSGDAANGFTIKNTNTETIEIPVKKVWVGPAAETLTVTLFADGEKQSSVELTAEDDWSYTFESLIKYDPEDGHEISYSVEEEELSGYREEMDGSISEGITFTNTNTETIDIPVEKQWVGPATDTVTVNLLADGEEAETAELTADTDWTYTFTELPKYDSGDGHEIVYDVEEVPVDGYTAGYSGTAETGFTITNTITGKVSVPVTKVWIGPAAEGVTVNLLANGQKIDSVQLSEDNDWQYTFTDLDQYDNGEEISYSISETPIDGYDSKVTGSQTGYTITNTNKEMTDIPVEKKWIGQEGGSVTIRLYADGTEYETLMLSKVEGWKSEFNDLPVYDNQDGHKIKYTISEDAVKGYTSKVEGNTAAGFTVTNTKNTPPTTPSKKSTSSTPSPAKPASSTSSQTSESGSVDSPKTGDENNLTLWLALLLTSESLLLLVLYKKKRDSKTQ